MKKKVDVIKSDFLVTDLPGNRFELFIDVLKNQWRNLLLLAIIILLICIPFIVLRYYNMVIITNMVNSDNMDNIRNNVFNSYVGYSFINSVVIIFIGVLFGGAGRVYKKLAFNDGLFLGADFIKGIKENFKDFIIMFSLYSIINLGLEILCINFLLDNNYLFYFFKVFNYFVLVPILFICVCLSSIYSDPIFVKIRSAYKIYIRYLPKIILLYSIVVLPLFLLLLGSSYIQLFIPIGYCLIYFPIVYLGFVIYMNGIFDKLINEKNFPDLVGKGMYKS